MTPHAGTQCRGRFDDPTGLEVRRDRPYDEQTPSHVLHPNGTSVDRYDRDLLAAFTREAFILWRQQ